MTPNDPDQRAAEVAAELEAARAEIADLKRSVAHYKDLFEQSNDAVFIYNDVGHILNVNQRTVEMLGYSREALLAMSVPDFHPSELLDDALAAFGELGRVGSARLTSKFKRADGSLIDVELSVRAVTPDATVFQGIARDITERVRAEEALRESEQFYQGIFQNNAAPKLLIDPATGSVFAANDAACRFYGYSREEFCSLFLWELNMLSEPVTRQRLAAAVAAKQTEFDVGHLLASGEVRDVHVYSSLVKASGRELLQAIIMDITERKRAEKEKANLEVQLRHAQKMDSVGRLAGGVAHDFNNMLSVILGNVTIAIEQVDPASPLRLDLEEVRTAAERSAKLTHQLLAFARKQTVTPKVLDMNETVESMLKMLRRLIGEDIHLNWLPNAELWPVKVDPSQIDQILANLCVNARDAIGGVGNLSIETGNSTFDEDYCATHAEVVPGEYVRLAVSDDGCGMDKATLGKLFEPFFTTKGVGQGTGLGLATVYGIVKQNNGFINVYSEVDRGTTFTIYLPRHVTKTEPVRRDSPTGMAALGHETILLVEDEPAILRMTTKMLARHGYTVLAASTPGEAIRLAESHPGEIHLLMTDVVMPEMNGRDLAKNLLSICPSIKRLFMSGYTSDVIASQGALHEGVHFIQKPFSARELAARVREALESE